MKLKIPHGGVVFIGDGRKALFLRNDGDEKFPYLKTEKVYLDDNPSTREQGTDRELAAVYVPTTPNPTSGYLEIVPVELLTPTDWTVDQAMSFIISGGAVAPESVPFTRAGDR